MNMIETVEAVYIYIYIVRFRKIINSRHRENYVF